MSTTAPAVSTKVASADSSERKKVTTATFRQKKERAEPITMLTAYDYPTALAEDQAGIDCTLVGDSLAMVVLGYQTTLPVTMDEMLHHCRAVSRGAKYALLIGDMPFMSYQASTEEAVRNAGRFLKEAGMEAVKLEGGRERVEAVRSIVAAGIPVMGHLGLTPQSINQFGGFKPQAKKATAARRLLEDALLLEEAGCFSLVLESVPARLAELVSKRLSIPTIGIGAGIGCDGQVQVINDILGSFADFVPKHAKQYVKVADMVRKAVTEYANEVKVSTFPTDKQSIFIDESVLAGLK